jgi:hypothetical protein
MKSIGKSEMVREEREGSESPINLRLLRRAIDCSILPKEEK